MFLIGHLFLNDNNRYFDSINSFKTDISTPRAENTWTRRSRKNDGVSRVPENHMNATLNYTEKCTEVTKQVLLWTWSSEAA